MKRAIAIFVLMTLFIAGNAQAATPSFQGLGDLSGDGFDSSAYGISSDGQTVVGQGASASGIQAFRWTKAGGMVGLGDLSGGTFYSVAEGVSSDGSVVAGQGYSTSGFEAFQWTTGGGMVGLGDLAGGDFYSNARGVSSNGQVVIGYGNSASGREAFRWTSTGGMAGLGDLSGGNFESWALGVSSNGSVIVGYGSSAASFASYDGATEAFRWTNDGGMVGLGDLPGGYFNSIARAVSSDGQVVVGGGSSAASFASYEGATEAFLWTSTDGMVGLGDLTGGDFWSVAEAVSSDGSVVVGGGHSSEVGWKAFIWDNVNGMQNLQDLLTNQYGLNLTGWTLLDATGISADGLTIVGWGYNPNGDTEAWIATVPEPASALLFIVGAGILRLRRKRD